MSSMASATLRSKVIGPLPALPLRPRVLPAPRWSHWMTVKCRSQGRRAGEDRVGPAPARRAGPVAPGSRGPGPELDPLIDPTNLGEALFDDPVRSGDLQGLGRLALACRAPGQA